MTPLQFLISQVTVVSAKCEKWCMFVPCMHHNLTARCTEHTTAYIACLSPLRIISGTQLKPRTKFMWSSSLLKYVFDEY